MSEPLESALAGVGVDAPHQVDFPLGDVRRHPEAPGNLHLGQAAATPTYGELQVASEDPPISSEFEAGRPHQQRRLTAWWVCTFNIMYSHCNHLKTSGELQE
jgi:hypothetical protein